MSRRGGNSASELLDALMGQQRNMTAEVAAANPMKKSSWRDADVCRYHLVSPCPHDLFLNTKFDLYSCRNKHDDACRDAFAAESPQTRLPIERQWMQYVEDRVIRPCDRRIREKQERVAPVAPITPAATTPLNTVTAASTEADAKLVSHPEIQALDAKIADLKKNADVLSMQIKEMNKTTAEVAVPATSPTESKSADAATPATPADSTSTSIAAAVTPSPQSLALQKLIDGMNAESTEIETKRAALLASLRPAVTAVPPTPVAAALAAAATTTLSVLPLAQRGQTVCNVCASMLRADETEERTLDHLQGKIHVAFETCRKKYVELQDAHKKLLADGVITEADMKNASFARPPPATSYSHTPTPAPAAAPSHPSSYSRDQQRGGPPIRDSYRPDPRPDVWRGGPPPPPPPQQYEYGRPVARMFEQGGMRGDGRRYPEAYHPHQRPYHQQPYSRSPPRHHDSRRRSHSRSRSRDRARSSRHRSSSRSSRSKSPRRHKSSRRSPSRSGSRSRSRDRKKSSSRRKHGSRSRSRSRESKKSKKKKSHKSDRKEKRSRSSSGGRSRSRSKKKDAVATSVAPPTSTITIPQQTDTFSAL